MTVQGAASHDLSETRIELTAVRRERLVAGYLPVEALQGLQEATAPLSVRLMIRPQPPRWRVTGEISGPVRLVCARCLQEYDTLLEAEVDRAFQAGEDPATRVQEREMDDDVEFLPDGMLVIRHLVDEELVLALPMLPLCRVECAGLCPGCGVDRNRAACVCPPSAGPLAALGVLLQKP